MIREINGEVCLVVGTKEPKTIRLAEIEQVLESTKAAIEYSAMELLSNFDGGIADEILSDLMLFVKESHYRHVLNLIESRNNQNYEKGCVKSALSPNQYHRLLEGEYQEIKTRLDGIEDKLNFIAVTIYFQNYFLTKS